MNREDKAQYYDWLMGQYQINENQISRIPKLSIEEQSKSVSISTLYSPENLKKVTHLQEILKKIESECKRIMV